MGQDKARPAGNSGSIFKGRNAVLAHLMFGRLRCALSHNGPFSPLRARLWGRAAKLHSLELALASPALARLAARPHSLAEMQRIYASGY